jgi:5-hydroxyisourate hydrolase
MTAMPTLSTHVLDTERGVPAEGVPVSLWQEDGASLTLLGTAETDRRGRIDALGDLQAGCYQLGFDVHTYYVRQGRQAPFLRNVAVQFTVDPSAEHYHVPLLVSPFGCTTYRGS